MAVPDSRHCSIALPPAATPGTSPGRDSRIDRAGWVDCGAVSDQPDKPRRRPRVFSGTQPSGTPHLGNYLGAFRNYTAMQETHDCVYCVVDLHAITVRQTRAELRRNTIELANTFLASGVDPERSIVIVQSHVPAHSELMWILNTITYMGELRRMTQFKDKTAGAEGESIGVGIFDYPVLMAADILLYQADAVPVGDDQRQHLELTRDIAQRFNNLFGETFTVPEVMIPPSGARIKGLDDPLTKMSKSLTESEYHAVYLLDPPDRVKKKIMRAVTDSGRDIRFSDDPEKAGVNNLLEIYEAFTGESHEAIETHFAQARGYGDLKKQVAEVVNAALQPIQQRYRELTSDKRFIDELLAQGAQRASLVANVTLARARENMGFLMPPG